MRARVVIVAIASGCGFHPSVSGMAADAGDAPIDQVPDVPIVPCHDRWLDGSVRFNAPTRLATLSMAGFSDRDPYVTPNGLTIYFSSNRADPVNGTSDIYVATRPTTADSFQAPTTFAAATTTADDGKLSMTDDGLHLVVSNNALVDADLYEATQPSGGPWGLLDTTHFGSTIDDGNNQQDPWMSNDGLRIFYALKTNVQHIAQTTRAAIDQNFQAAVIVAGLDSDTGDADPALSSDERIVVFSSARTLAGLGGSNMWYATRAGSTGAFDAPQAMPDLNTAKNDGDPVLAADGCEVYFASDTSGDYDLYVATMRD